MNTTILEKFEALVCSLMMSESQRLGVTKREAKKETYATWIIYEGAKLAVEFVHGAPDYETQFFLSSPITSQRYSFSDLMQYDEIKSWVMKNRLVLHDEERIEPEIRWIISFITWLLEISAIGSKLFPEIMGSEIMGSE